MAENNFIKHAFVSPKVDGPDSTLVRPSNWNDGHTLAGGINGQLLMFDNTQDNNMKYVSGPFSLQTVFSQGATASPFETSTLHIASLNTPGIGVYMAYVSAVTSGAAAYTLSLIINSTSVIDILNVASGAKFTIPYFSSLSAGNTAFALRFTANSGTFTSIEGTSHLFTIGRL